LNLRCKRFKWILSDFSPQNSNKITKNQVMERKISWEHDHTWRSTNQFKADFFSYLTIEKLNLYLAKLSSYSEFPLFCIGFTLVPTTHATLDVWIVIYVYIFNWNICIGKPWHRPCVFYILLIEPSQGFWTQTMILTVLYVKFFFAKIWRSREFCGCGVKIFLIGREDMADRRTGEEGAISKSKLH